MLFDIATGQSPYLYAAIKSLPFDFGEISALSQAGADSPVSLGSSSGSDSQHLEVASDLAAQCKEMLAGEAV